MTSRPNANNSAYRSSLSVLLFGRLGCSPTLRRPVVDGGVATRCRGRSVDAGLGRCGGAAGRDPGTAALCLPCDETDAMDVKLVALLRLLRRDAALADDARLVRDGGRAVVAARTAVRLC